MSWCPASFKAKIICLANLESGPSFDLCYTKSGQESRDRALTMVLRALVVMNFGYLYKPEGFDNRLHHIELLKM